MCYLTVNHKFALDATPICRVCSDGPVNCGSVQRIRGDGRSTRTDGLHRLEGGRIGGLGELGEDDAAGCTGVLVRDRGVESECAGLFLCSSGDGDQRQEER